VNKNHHSDASAELQICNLEHNVGHIALVHVLSLHRNFKCIAVQKHTKAQKRREQRAADEAEREARIVAEQAGQGSSLRQEEAEQLRLLQPLGLAVKDIPVSKPATGNSRMSASRCAQKHTPLD
jgi:hypothetical protein